MEQAVQASPPATGLHNAVYRFQDLVQLIVCYRSLPLDETPKYSAMRSECEATPNYPPGRTRHDGLDHTSS